MHVRLLSAITALAAFAALGAAALTATASAAVTGYTVHAVTAITSRPDSGAHGNDWADDAFTRTAHLYFHGEVALSNCGGSTGTGHCYRWTGNVHDQGTFTTRTSGDVPGNGYLNGGTVPQLEVAVTGTMTGVYRYVFYSSWKTASAGLVPPAQSGMPSGRSTTGMWPTQFFGNGARFWNGTGTPEGSGGSVGTNGGWLYTAAPGSDPQCPHVTSQWTDASATSWGSLAADGNILAPGAAHC